MMLLQWYENVGEGLMMTTLCPGGAQMRYASSKGSGGRGSFTIMAWTRTARLHSVCLIEGSAAFRWCGLINGELPPPWWVTVAHKHSTRVGQS